MPRPPALGGTQPDFQKLRARLEACDLDKPGDAAPFTARLAAGCGWSRDKARRVTFEYRRFVAIALCSGYGACPSRAVDEAWHLHLLDTKRYWGEFCREVLQRDFHHEPSRGGIEEDLRLAQLYRQTLADYRRLFGEEPPTEIWPDPDAAAAGGFSRAGGSGLLARLQGLLGSLSPMALLLAVPGCAALYNSPSPGALQGPAFLLLYAVVLGLAATGCVAVQNGHRLVLVPGWPARAATPPRFGRWGSGAQLGVYHLAYLTGGGQRVFETAMARLYAGGEVVLQSRRPVLVRRASSLAEPPEQLIADRLGQAEVTLAADAVDPVLARIERDLTEARLLRRPRELDMVRWMPFLAIGPLLALGLVRLGFGMAYHRPVPMLIMALALTGIVLALLRRRVVPPLPAALRFERSVRAELGRQGRPSVTSPELSVWVAVFGTSALAEIGLLDFAAFLDGLAPQTAGGKSRSSCGGGGCSGDGAGGCGGGAGCGG